MTSEGIEYAVAWDDTILVKTEDLDTARRQRQVIEENYEGVRTRLRARRITYSDWMDIPDVPKIQR